MKGGLESLVSGLRWWGDDGEVLPGCCVGGVTLVLARASEKGARRYKVTQCPYI